MADGRTEIGAGTIVTGDIAAQEDVVVFGRVEGSISSTTAVIIEDGGEARARIHAPSVLIAGVVIGQVQATARVEIAETGRVLGDVATPRLVLQDGGAVRGKVVMDGSRPAAAAPAPAPAARTASWRAAPAAPAAAPAARRGATTTRTPAPAPVRRPAPARAAAPAALPLGDDGQGEDRA